MRGGGGGGAPVRARRALWGDAAGERGLDERESDGRALRGGWEAGGRGVSRPPLCPGGEDPGLSLSLLPLEVERAVRELGACRAEVSLSVSLSLSLSLSHTHTQTHTTHAHERARTHTHNHNQPHQ
jgi:hypothetical protein